PSRHRASAPPARLWGVHRLSPSCVQWNIDWASRSRTPPTTRLPDGVTPRVERFPRSRRRTTSTRRPATVMAIWTSKLFEDIHVGDRATLDHVVDAADIELLAMVTGDRIAMDRTRRTAVQSTQAV